MAMAPRLHNVTSFCLPRSSILPPDFFNTWLEFGESIRHNWIELCERLQRNKQALRTPFPDYPKQHLSPAMFVAIYLVKLLQHATSNCFLQSYRSLSVE